MRDEVLAEWVEGTDGPTLHIHCQVSGETKFGSAGFCYRIFWHHLPMALNAIAYGGRSFIANNESLMDTLLIVHFQARQKK